MGNRRNNPQDMTMTEELEKLKESVCLDYCKFFAEIDKKAKALKPKDKDYSEKIADLQEEMAEHCKGCPVTRL